MLAPTKPLIMRITIDQYFGSKKHTPEHEVEAESLLLKVDMLLGEFELKTGLVIPIDSDTETHISGSKGGQGDGGFRLSDTTTGRARSSHKEARGVDVCDIGETIDQWLNDEILTKYGLYRESPKFTVGWCHLTTRPPKSGRRTFIP